MTQYLINIKFKMVHLTLTINNFTAGFDFRRQNLTSTPDVYSIEWDVIVADISMTCGQFPSIVFVSEIFPPLYSRTSKVFMAAILIK